MQDFFKAVSLSHNNAPLGIRELVALDEEAIGRLLKYFKEFTEASEVLVLSTCNRTEVYYQSSKDLSQDIIKLIGIERGVQDMSSLAPYFNCITDHQEAIRHLFYVSMGLEAQVVGDIQISNQVKRAYQASADMDLAGPFLHRIMHTIFYTNKRVVQETPFRDGAASVSYAATEIVSTLAEEIISPKVLVMGVGEIGADVCRNLAKTPGNQVKITNRTLEKAQELAAECQFEVLPFEQVWEGIAEADVIISSLGSLTPFIQKSQVEQLDIPGIKYFIDLSVPRSIEMEVEQVPGAMVYNIDNIRSKADDALQRRTDAIPHVKQIVEEAIVEFNEWTKEMIVSPTIHKLKNALEQIRQEELARALKSMDEQQTKALDKVTKRMMQKIIKLPVLQLKAACKRGEAETLIDVLNDLFNLEQQPEEIKKGK